MSAKTKILEILKDNDVDSAVIQEIKSIIDPITFDDPNWTPEYSVGDLVQLKPIIGRITAVDPHDQQDTYEIEFHNREALNNWYCEDDLERIFGQ